MKKTTPNKKGRTPHESAAPTTGVNHSAAPTITADFNGLPVSFMGDGWFNATAAAKHFGKRLAHWQASPDTKAYIAALAKILKYPDFGYLIRAQRGQAGGTWLHPKLAVSFARWCDAEFAVWCDMQIDHILRGGVAIWDKPGAARSTTPDREPLLTAAAAIVARHRLPFGPVYAALNTYAGVMHAREMSCEQVSAASEFAGRLLAGTTTSDDFEILDRHRAALGISASQLSFGGAV